MSESRGSAQVWRIIEWPGAGQVNVGRTKYMKLYCLSLLGIGLIGLTAVGSPIPKDQIAADAKWILHLDTEQFMRGKIGSYLIDEVLNPRSALFKETLKQQLGFDLDWKQIKGITAYGTGYHPQEDDSGILLIRTSMDVKGALEAAMAKAIPQLRIEKIENAPLPLYRFNDQGYVAVPSSDLVLVARQRNAIDRGREILEGHTDTLAAAQALQDYPESPFGFFLLAVAEGFGQQADLPATAAIFKQATGARLLLGEDNGRLRLNFDLKAASSEVVQQIQQVAQGLLALAAMNAGQNPDLQKLTQAAAVTSSGKCVTLAVAIPVTDIIAKIKEHHP